MKYTLPSSIYLGPKNFRSLEIKCIISDCKDWSNTHAGEINYNIDLVIFGEKEIDDTAQLRLNVYDTNY